MRQSTISKLSQLKTAQFAEALQDPFCMEAGPPAAEAAGPRKVLYI